MFKIPDINSHKYRQIIYFLPWALGLIGLCLLVVIPWHFLLKPLGETRYEWAQVVFFIAFTYIMGLRAKSTGNPDIIGGFQILIFYTFAWSFMMIGLVIESLILFFLGFALLCAGCIYGFIGYRKLTQVGFYSDVPPILRAASRLNHGVKGRFSNKPYKAQIEKYHTNELKKYAKLLLKYGIALSVKDDSDSITIYVRKPGNIMKMVLIPGSGFFGQSWIKIHSDGHVKVFVSQKAYEFLDSPGSYEELCNAIAQIIDESASLYISDDEQQALKKLGVGI